MPVAREPVLVLEVAERDYERVLEMQRLLLEEVADGGAPPVLLVCEHDPVVTIGGGNQRLGEARVEAVPPSPEALRGRPLVSVERGGGVTVHGPGQVVGYPVIRLEDHDVRAHLRALEDGLVRALATFGVAARALEGKTGVWVGPEEAPRKIASIGVAVRRWTTFHGFALNTSIDPAAFAGLDPCGFDAAVMTSLEKELGRPAPLAEVKRAVVRAVVAALEGRG